MPRAGDAGDSSRTHICPPKSATPYPDAPETKTVPRSDKPELEGSYTLHNTIGKGGFSKVKMGIDVSTGAKVAIKIIDKESIGAELPRIVREIKTLQSLSHPHICQLMGVIESGKATMMIMEYCPTDLYNFIMHKNGRLSEYETRRFFIQLMSAVAYLHMKGIVHRDLKPENILLDFLRNVKLTDFGLCAVQTKTGVNKALLRTACGSPAYCAPELLSKRSPYIGSKADVWSLGVILFVLLCSYLPFQSKNIRDLYNKIQELDYVIPEWVPAGAKDLIERILQENVNKRPSLNQLWFHPWIQESGYMLDPYRHQIKLAQKEIRAQSMEYDFYGEVPRSVKPIKRPSMIVGYMDSSQSPAKDIITVVAAKSSMLESCSSDQQESQGCTNLEEESSMKPKKLRIRFSRMKQLFLNVIPNCIKRSLFAAPVVEYSSEEPREVDSETLHNDIRMTGLTIVDEEFADRILDKLQMELQIMGIPSKRKGSTIKNGAASPCEFNFEVLSLEDLGRFCIWRKYLRSKDPNVVKNVVQHVLLLSI